MPLPSPGSKISSAADPLSRSARARSRALVASILAPSLPAIRYSGCISAGIAASLEPAAARARRLLVEPFGEPVAVAGRSSFRCDRGGRRAAGGGGRRTGGRFYPAFAGVSGGSRGGGIARGRSGFGLRHGGGGFGCWSGRLRRRRRSGSRRRGGRGPGDGDPSSDLH